MRQVPEWRSDNPDTAIPPRVMVRVFFRCEGKCAACSRKLTPGNKPQYDHIMAIANGGEHRETNLQLLCEWCHKKKTAVDVAQKSRTYRKQLANIGIKTKGRPLPCGRDSPFKKRLDGSVVRR